MSVKPAPAPYVTWVQGKLFVDCETAERSVLRSAYWGLLWGSFFGSLIGVVVGFFISK